uniref:Helicase C-terminal domain-containing protein n=1 Tax=Rhabditophanes sp. KR3021 TaxID=114890 RepID=A0AC35U2S6_9BILA
MTTFIKDLKSTSTPVLVYSDGSVVSEQDAFGYRGHQFPEYVPPKIEMQTKIIMTDPGELVQTLNHILNNDGTRSSMKMVIFFNNNEIVNAMTHYFRGLKFRILRLSDELTDAEKKFTADWFNRPGKAILFRTDPYYDDLDLVKANIIVHAQTARNYELYCLRQKCLIQKDTVFRKVILVVKDNIPEIITFFHILNKIKESGQASEEIYNLLDFSKPRWS